MRSPANLASAKPFKACCLGPTHTTTRSAILGITLGIASTWAALSEDGAPGLARIPSAQVPEALTLGLGLYNRLANSGDLPDAFNSLIVDDQVVEGGRRKGSYLMATDHTVALSLAGGRFYEAHLALPLYYQDLSMTGREVSGIFQGDLRFGVQLSRAFGEGDKPWALGFQLGGTLPTAQPGSGAVPRRLEENPANPDIFARGSRAGGTTRGDARTGMSLTLDLTKAASPYPFAFTATGFTRTTSIFVKHDDDFYDIVGWGALIEWRATEALTAFTEYLHEGRFEDDLPSNTELNEVGVGLAYRFENGITLLGGGAWGLHNGGGAPAAYAPEDGEDRITYKLLGAPDAHVYAGITFEAKVGNLDPDRDGIMGKLDKCPNEAEDSDGFEDNDGCPDSDNDKDGVSDMQDACPNQAEDLDGFEDADGCPDFDNDSDGLPDAKDVCPNDAEDKDGFEDNDGCPDKDNDQDGVPDSLDQCKSEPQGVNGKDGCPVRDADLDGISDNLDKCPNEKEIVNGYQDADGCPDKAPIEEKTLVLKGVNFETGKAILTPESLPVLDDLATQLMAAPNIVLEVSGHTDSKGNAQKNVELSKGRAQAVADYLLTKGVAKERLVVKGYGAEKPMASNKTAEGRMLNRRVEFNRLK